MKTGTPDAPPRRPALIFCDKQTGGLKIAALTLLDRLVVAIHRAGASPITIVTCKPLPVLKRTKALGISVQLTSEPPVRDGTTLVAASNILVQTADVRTLLLQGGRLATKDGRALPLGVLAPGEEPRKLGIEFGVPSSHGPRTARPEVGTPSQTIGSIIAAGIAYPVTDAATAREAERALWASLTSSSDGLVDRVFNRPCGRFLSKVLIYTPVSPNAVSLASIVIGLGAAGGFAWGSHQAIILAAILFQLSAIVDCVDGDLARVLFKESPLGKWLDLAGDQVVHIAVFAGIAAGLMRGGAAPFALWLGTSAVLGALLSFAVVLRGMRLPAGEQTQGLQKLIDAATNRDFSVLVLLLACINRLEWFLWMSAIGSHVFWLTALALQRRSGSNVPTPPP